MLKTDLDILLENFIRRMRAYWQVIFISSILFYGAAFAHHFSTQRPPRIFSYFSAVDLASFVIAIFLAITIFQLKRRIFSLRQIRLFLEKIVKEEPELDDKMLIRRLTRQFGKKMKTVWLMGGGLILLGVVFYWLTFTTKNMHIYFIVGLYSLLMNYPRKDLFMDVSYLIREVRLGSPADKKEIS
ncbi:MAG: hypothetical protein WAN36_03295 [Calditrichia bacterium]